MRHLFLLSTAGGYGGAERSLELIARHLRREARLTVFAGNPLHVAALRRILAPPSRLIETPDIDTGPGLAAACRATLAAWRADRPDALLANTQRGAQIASAVAPYAPGLAGRCFIYVRDFQWRSFDFLSAPLGGAHVFVPDVCVAERAGYLAPHLAPSGPLAWSVMPDMVDLPRDAAEPVGTGPVLHLAAYNRFKGRAHLIRAAGLLKRAGRVLPVLSRGMPDDPALPDEFRRMIGEWDISASFDLGDHVEDPAPLFDRCSCVAVTSVSQFGGPETFGRSIIEAWAHRRPVVAFAAGGPEHLIEHGIDGLLVEEGNDEALAQALWRLHADPALRARLGAAGFAKAERRFETGQVVHRLTAAMASHLGVASP